MYTIWFDFSYVAYRCSCSLAVGQTMTLMKVHLHYLIQQHKSFHPTFERYRPLQQSFETRTGSIIRILSRGDMWPVFLTRRYHGTLTVTCIGPNCVFCPEMQLSLALFAQAMELTRHVIIPDLVWSLMPACTDFSHKNGNFAISTQSKLLNSKFKFKIQNMNQKFRFKYSPTSWAFKIQMYLNLKGIWSWNAFSPEKY